MKLKRLLTWSDRENLQDDYPWHPARRGRLTVTRRCSAALAAAALAATLSANAQTFPSRPITVILPTASGNSADSLFRAVNAEVGKRLGQPVVAENRTGANGTLGLLAIKQSKPDGHTLAALQDGAMTALPVMDTSFQLEIGRDYGPVVFLFEYPYVIIGNPALPFKDLKGLMSYAKANPGRLNFVIQQGTASHIFGELLRHVGGIDMTMVPYKSAGAAVPDLMSGRVDLAPNSISAQPLVQSGKVSAIFVTSKERWAPYPSVGTMSEAGIPINFTTWYTLVAHSETPRDALAKLQQAFSESMKLPSVTAMVATQGLITYPDMKPAEITERAKMERNAWTPIIRKANITLQ